MKAFRTVLRSEQAEIVEKKSRFIATVLPVEREEEIEPFLARLRKEYWDASHNVYAYRVGLGKMTERFSDDGEPVHTAGLPVLSVLRKEEICNVCVVVTRYFGGTLLGTGGLVRAYSRAAQEALSRAGIITKETMLRYSMDMDYTMLGKAQYGMMNEGWSIVDTQYADKVRMKLLIPEGDRDRFLKACAELSDGRLCPEDEGTVLAAGVDGVWHYFGLPEENNT